MDKNIEQDKYESLKKSLNNAIKLLCNKIQDIKKEVKELKEDKVKHSMNTSKLCSCTKTNEDMKNKFEKLNGSQRT